MHKWNVVVTARDRAYEEIHDLIASFGAVSHTEYYNVLIMQVDDINGFVADFDRFLKENPGATEGLSRLMPVTDTFYFQTPDEFEDKAKVVAAHWVPQLAGKRFHVRMHRRGFKGRLSSQDEERFLDFFILGELDKRGESAHITFDDPDYIVAVETVGQRAGMALWSREDMARFPFLKLD